MSEAERKARGAKSAVIVERLVRVQLRAMGCERFDLGVKRDAGEMILREGRHRDRGSDQVAPPRKRQRRSHLHPAGGRPRAEPHR